MKLQKTFFIIPFIFLIFACKQEKKENKIIKTKPLIKYAKGFEIQKFETYKKLIISSPYPNANSINIKR